MAEVLTKNKDKIRSSSVLEELGLEQGKYIVVSAHREENIDNEKNFFSLMNAINAVAEIYGLPIVYSTHPRSWKRIEEKGFQFNDLLRQCKPFGFFDYNKLQMNSFCVLSDSGTLSEEAAILDFPAILIRTSTERPEVLVKGTFIVGGIVEKDILRAIELCRAIRESSEIANIVPDYVDENVSVKVVKVIGSFTSIINKVVWGKN